MKELRLFLLKSLEGIKLTDIIQTILAVAAFVIGCLTINSWKKEKEFDIKIEAKSNIPKLLSIANSLFIEDINNSKNTTISASDSLLFKKLIIQFPEKDVIIALNNRRNFRIKYDSLINDIIECNVILNKLSNGITHESVIIKQDSEAIELDNDIKLYSLILLKIDSVKSYDKYLTIEENILLSKEKTFGFDNDIILNSSIECFYKLSDNTIITNEIQYYNNIFFEKIKQLSKRKRVDHPIIGGDPIHPPKQ